ncbi:MAG: helix-turn-helix domain-containing protein [Polaromonas sp.]|jgi:AraC family transcriptional activator of pobA|nr:helix-turn-helix domain-containing protein [Polaromonas sp.]MBP7308680.1 helix-turn-helix domain-containing protein [Polaromonas sp.]MBP9057574.1 helix-turn-helix domain-containing protein [Polaromonas sp.]MBP9831339.1 helix-turn-helix domain-containing protein [Polaromonas sp.]
MSLDNYKSSPKKKSIGEIPSFALYGESAVDQHGLLHIEEIQSRSRLYHWEIDPHVHHGLYQVVWLQAGVADLVLDNVHETVTAPAAIVIPPRVVHGFHFTPETHGQVLTISAQFLSDADAQAIGADAAGKLFSAPRILRFATDDPNAARLGSLMNELLGEFILPNDPQSPIPGWLAQSVIWRLARSHVLEQLNLEGRAHLHHAVITRLLSLVEQHFLEHWPMQRYAAELGLTTPRMNRITQSLCQCNALEMVHERLTKEACRRLIYIAAPAANLAAELGFDDPAYFSRFFKNRTGMSPNQYRKLNQGVFEVK